MDNLLTVPEAAQRLGVTRQWVLALCAQGRVRGAKKIGRQWLIPAGAKVDPPPPKPAGRPLRTKQIPL
ncbi:MAG: helix-turn-helix domain-containing protein [Gammaproteobacteria bacterium]